MGLILEFKDYADVHEAHELAIINEGILGNIWSKIKDAFKGISGKVNQTIVTEEIDKMFDPKTGELTKPLLDQINSMTNVDTTKKAFANIKGMVQEGWYFQQSLKFMEDGIVTLMDQAAATKVGSQQAGKTAAQKTKAQGTESKEATAAQSVVSEQMKKRIADFDAVYRKAKENAKKQVQAKMAELIKKSSSESSKTFINNRFSTCETVLLLIEYDVKKLRLNLEGLDQLKKEMTESYKMALDSAKQLQQQMTMAKAPSMTYEAYNNLDINGFVNEYPAQAANAGDPDNELFVYPYEERHIVITAYDVNKKTVTVNYVNNHKVTDETLSEPFDDFKRKFIESSEGVQPQKQKGGVTKPADKTPAAAAGGTPITQPATQPPA